MLVIDIHGHPPFLLKGEESKYVPPKTQEAVISEMVEDAKKMIESMDAAKIDIKVLLPFGKDADPKFHYSEKDPSTGVTTFSSNEWVAKAQEKYPERFLGFACIDPTRKEAIQELEETVTKYGFKGVKLFPSLHHYEPNDTKVYPFYEKCIELGIVAAFHMGCTRHSKIDRLQLEYPLLLDALARDLPELKIIICHVGRHWLQEGTLVAFRNENVYVDISSLHVYCAMMVHPIEPSTAIKRIVEILGDEKILYGTDNTDQIMNIFFIEGLELGKEATRKIMGENAAKLLNLPLGS